MTKQQTITIPLEDLIWDILGDDKNGLPSARISILTGVVLEEKLKGSTLWRVEWTDKDGIDLDYPILWRYQDWVTSEDRHTKQKNYSHNERVTRWILEANVNLVARAVAKHSSIPIESARGVAYKLVTKGNSEVLLYFGVHKLITKEEEL